MYKIKLYLKYIKHCIFKKPLSVTTISYNEYKNVQNLITFPDKFYELITPNGNTAVAIFKEYIKHDRTMTYRSYYSYTHSYYWNFLGYENKPLLHDCKWSDFKLNYTSLFYPHLADEDEITIRLVADKLSVDFNLPESTFTIR